jgi:DNA-binding transcriptional MerR regulator
MRIKELVEKSGVSRTTIHFYLREGLLHRPRKTGRTMAYYDDSHLQRLRDIQKLKKGSRMLISFLKGHVNSGGLNTEQKQARDMSKAVTTTREKQQKRQEIIHQGIKVFSQ